MKKQLFPTAILRSFLILASLLLMIIFSLQPSFSKECTTIKTVFYKGEWIMRVDLPEVNIAATRILKGGIAPLLKHVSSSDPERKGELVILTEDININASNPSELVKETAIINDNNNESTFTIEVVMIEGEKASQIQLLVSKNEDGKQQLS